MKKRFLLSILVLVCLLAGLIDGCKKDSLDKPTNGIETSFTEEFEDNYKLETTGWVQKDNSVKETPWAVGGIMKAGAYFQFQFDAYSYTQSTWEYMAAITSITGTNYAISSWLITPVLAIENGDKISFYSRTDTGNVYQNRIQVLMNASASADVGNDPGSVGRFTTVLLDINSTLAAGGYPTDWTKYEYTFTGISGKVDRRIGFRYFVPNTANSSGIAIDQFKFEK